MKFSGFFRVLGLAVIISLLLVAIPVSPAYAAMLISVEPTSGKIGDTITVSGTGFSPSDDTNERHVDVYFAADAASTVDDIGSDVNTYKYLKTPAIGYVDDPDEGDFTTTFTVPSTLNDGTVDKDVSSGTYYIYVTLYNTTRIKAISELTVVGGDISISPRSGPVGTQVEISGSDFGSREYISFEYDGSSVDFSGDNRASTSGDFDSSITVPESTGGDHTITVIGGNSNSGLDATFTINAGITISPDSGPSGSQVTVSGTGFGDRTNVTIYMNNAKQTSKTSDRYGSFEVPFAVPVLGPGQYTIEADDGHGNSDVAEFTIAIGGDISATTGNIGTQVTVTGNGFIASHEVNITYDSAQVATATTNADGDFEATFTVPVSTHGDHTITATDGTNTKQFSFAVESTPPPAPQLLIPASGAKAKAMATFDWQDISDPSLPITYTLQISSDQSFSSLVLEKTNLTVSNYTLTPAEKLESMKDAPYYWRVMAKDGASNQGEWSVVGSFFVGSQFSLPQWVMYVIYAIGAIVIFILGVWLGRRTSYSY
jgi:hypothetical protein